MIARDPRLYVAALEGQFEINILVNMRAVNFQIYWKYPDKLMGAATESLS
jgi:hypothetical protein